MRGQAFSEYLLVVAFIVALAAFFVLPGAHQTEVTMGLAGARLGCAEYSAIENSSVYCTEFSYAASGPNLTIYPKVFDLQGKRVTDLPGSFYARVISGIAGNILNNRSFSCVNCISCWVGHYNYCVNATS
ncbi:MAG: hypothetical protein ACP5O3_01095 [Candidatus Micrarchaeia archaeon]